jgi:cell cycle checkpoint protein
LFRFNIFILCFLKIDLTSDSEYVESFDCKKTQINRYKVSFIKNSLKALAASSKAAIRVSENGIMSIQFLIQINETQAAFAEFYVRSLF